MSSIATGAAVPIRDNEILLTSTTFKGGQPMPARTGLTRNADGMCVGENLSPQFSWTRPPATAKSLTLTEHTEEGANGLGEVNLVVYGIPATITSLAEGELSNPSGNFVGGANRFGNGTWRGSCPPAGTRPHHYVFQLIATDYAPDELPPGLTYDELHERLQGHAVGVGAIVGYGVAD